MSYLKLFAVLGFMAFGLNVKASLDDISLITKNKTIREKLGMNIIQKINLIVPKKSSKTRQPVSHDSRYYLMAGGCKGEVSIFRQMKKIKICEEEEIEGGGILQKCKFVKKPVKSVNSSKLLCRKV